MIGLDGVVQIFDLAMQLSFGSLPSRLSSARAAAYVGALSVLMIVGCCQSLSPFRAFPRKRFVACVFRVGDR